MLEGSAQKKTRLGSDSELSVRFGDVIFTTVPLTRVDLSVNQIASGKIHRGENFYNAIKNGESVQEPSSSMVGVNDSVDILFDCTDGYKACKL